MEESEIALRKALDLSEYDRLQQLYEQYYGEAFHSDDSGEPKISTLQKFFRKLDLQVKGMICGSKKIHEAASLAGSDRMTLGLLICDALSTYLDKPAVFLMAAQILHIGLNQFCIREWNE